jgi:hypothetical protein
LRTQRQRIVRALLQRWDHQCVTCHGALQDRVGRVALGESGRGGYRKSDRLADKPASSLL